MQTLQKTPYAKTHNVHASDIHPDSQAHSYRTHYPVITAHISTMLPCLSSLSILTSPSLKTLQEMPYAKTCNGHPSDRYHDSLVYLSCTLYPFITAHISFLHPCLECISILAIATFQNLQRSHYAKILKELKPDKHLDSMVTLYLTYYLIIAAHISTMQPWLSSIHAFKSASCKTYIYITTPKASILISIGNDSVVMRQCFADLHNNNQLQCCICLGVSAGKVVSRKVALYFLGIALIKTQSAQKASVFAPYARASRDWSDGWADMMGASMFFCLSEYG